MRTHKRVCCIVPPHILVKLAEHSEFRDKALRTLILTEQLRGRRSVLGALGVLAVGAGQKRRTIYDVEHGSDASLPGRLVRGEGDPAAGDVTVSEAYDFSGETYDFYQQVFGRNSIDNHGMRLD